MTPKEVLAEWDRYTLDQIGPVQAARRNALRQALMEVERLERIAASNAQSL